MNNLSELRDAVKDWTHNDELSASQIDSFVRLVDGRLNSDLRLMEMENSATLTLTAGSSSVDLPSRFAAMISLVFDGDDALLIQQPRDVVVRSQESATAGKPRAFAIVGDTLVFDRAADVAYPLKLRFYSKLDLVTDNTNTVLTRHPQVYLYGCLAEANRYLEAWGQADKFAQMFEGELERVKIGNHDRRGRSRVGVDPALVGRGVFNINTGGLG